MVWSDLEFPGQGSKIMNYEVTIRKLGRACSGNPVNTASILSYETPNSLPIKALYGVNGR